MVPPPPPEEKDSTEDFLSLSLDGASLDDAPCHGILWQGQAATLRKKGFEMEGRVLHLDLFGLCPLLCLSVSWVSAQSRSWSSPKKSPPPTTHPHCPAPVLLLLTAQSVLSDTTHSKTSCHTLSYSLPPPTKLSSVNPRILIFVRLFVSAIQHPAPWEPRHDLAHYRPAEP